MQIEIKSKKDVPLLSRTRVSAVMTYEGATPSRDEATKKLAAMLATSEKLTVIRHIYTRFGKNTAKIITHVYKNEADMRQIEDQKLLKKHLKEEAAPAAEGQQPAQPAQGA
jgi:ribosomal protein S24E